MSNGEAEDYVQLNGMACYGAMRELVFGALHTASETISLFLVKAKKDGVLIGHLQKEMVHPTEKQNQRSVECAVR